MRRLALFLPLALLLLAVSPGAVKLRNLGIAQLENEKPDQAVASFIKVVHAAPDDPLGYADLAIAFLREQRNDEARNWIDKALAKEPGRAKLLAIKGDVLQWSGDTEGALALYRQAAAAAPDQVEIQYGVYRLATTVESEEADAAARQALQRLAALRPENAVVLLHLGQRAIADGDRATATHTFQRLGELLWQGPPVASRAMQMVLSALEGEDLSAARVPALRMENVLKVTPMYQQGLRELFSGIQGVPITRFADEPPPESFGAPLEVEWERQQLADAPGAAVAVADFDGDDRSDLAWVTVSAGPQLEVRLAAAGWVPGARLPAPGIDRLLAADLDNDGVWDLVGTGQRVEVWKGDGHGGFTAAAADLGLQEAKGEAAAAFDFDIEGDLDLALGGPGLELYRNALSGPLEAVGEHAFPDLDDLPAVRRVLATDLDLDGDLDLLVADAGGLLWLDNLRQGHFRDRTAASGLDGAASLAAVVAADLDGDGDLDLVAAGDGLHAFRNAGVGSFEAWRPGLVLSEGFAATDLEAFDLDNDGRLDLAAGGTGGVILFHQQTDGRFERQKVPGVPEVRALAAVDFDGDGDLDLAATGAGGLLQLVNEGGNGNRWLEVRLRGLTKGNSKNNVFGLGSTVEVRAGSAYQLREAIGGVTHFGLGKLPEADLLRVVWTNGVPQNRLQVKGDQRVVEEQILKGSCPFLYAWNGEEVAFVTDLLWGAPAGLPVGPEAWAGADPDELVKVEGAVPHGGVYDLRVTEELWEAAFIDYARLWVVDHPAEVEVDSALRILPGRSTPQEVRGSRRVRPVVAAWDGAGREVTERVRSRDEVYASGYAESPYQGVAEKSWSTTFDLGTAPGGPVRLLLDGWIFPTDASLNLALAQRGDLAPMPPRLEVETAGGWQPLLEEMGFPAGKTKTMVVDTPPLPAGAHRLRIVTGQWLAWDRIAWTSNPDDQAPVVVARLAPATAELRYRGFSAPRREAPNAPHAFDYAANSTTSPWLPFPGHYTRYGDVRPLLAASDSHTVVMGAGDEIGLVFDPSALPPPPPGWQRSVFLESHGWDKDADRNTYAASSVEPLPFRGMSGYPYGPDETFPATAADRRYVEEWLTRVVE